MFKKLITLMIVLAIFTVQASASTHTGLKAAFDELNFALTVEWDQKDKKFHEDQMKKFHKTLTELQAQGLTNGQMMEFVKAEVKDARIAKDIETAFTMISINKMTTAEASKYMTDTMKKSYSAGASWNGKVMSTIVIGAFLIGVLIIMLAVDGPAQVQCPGGKYWVDDICETEHYDFEYGYYYSTYYECGRWECY